MKKIIAVLVALATTVAQAEFTGYTPEELKAMSVEDIQSNFGLTLEEAKMSHDVWKKLVDDIPSMDIQATLTGKDILTYHFEMQNIVDKKIIYKISYDSSANYIKMEDSRMKNIYEVDNRYGNLRTEITCEGPYGTYTTETRDSGKYQKPIAFDPICVFYNTDYYLSSYNEGDKSKKEKKAEELRHMSQLDYVALMGQGRLTEQDIFNALYNFPNMPTSLKEGDHIDMVEMTGKDLNGDPIGSPVRYTLVNADQRIWNRMDVMGEKEVRCTFNYINFFNLPMRNHVCVFYNEIQKASL